MPGPGASDRGPLVVERLQPNKIIAATQVAARSPEITESEVVAGRIGGVGVLRLRGTMRFAHRPAPLRMTGYGFSISPLNALYAAPVRALSIRLGSCSAKASQSLLWATVQRSCDWSGSDARPPTPSF